MTLRSTLGILIRSLVGRASRTRAGRFAFDRLTDATMELTRAVVHNGVRLRFAVPNGLNQFRVDTFATKEPETLGWIDRIPEGSTLWDIGANVGLYTCYAALARRCTVYAFEPSVFNLELLARNIALNGVTDRAIIVPLPLAAARGVNRLRMTSTEWGGALSTFGEDYGYDGKPLKPIFEFQTAGMSMTEACQLLGIPRPDFIKMDVDGIEHLILAGGGEVLRGVRSVLVEINDAFGEQAQNATRLLRAAGLEFRERQLSPVVTGTAFESTANQLWERRSG